MMTDTDDRLLREFFAPARREVPDNGFTRRLMRRLPTRRRYLLFSRLWTALCLGLALWLFITLDVFALVFNALREAVIATVESATTNVDPASLFLAVVVLVALGCRKIASMA